MVFNRCTLNNWQWCTVSPLPTAMCWCNAWLVELDTLCQQGRVVAALQVQRATQEASAAHRLNPRRPHLLLRRAAPMQHLLPHN